MTGAWVLLAAAVAAAQPIAYPSFPSDPGFTSVARWLERETGIARRNLIAVEDGLAWALASPGGEVVSGQAADLRIEAVSAAGWKALGGRSATVVVDTDCTAQRAGVRSAALYAASNLLGEARKGLGPADIPIGQDALKAVGVGLCQREGRTAPPVAVASAEPSPAPPQPPAVPALLFPAPSAPATPAPPPIQPRQAPPSPPAFSPDPVGPMAQVGAFTSSAAALLALRDLAMAEPRLLKGKLQRVEPMAAAGGALYRALVTGFASAAEAEAFCKAMSDARKACLVRP